MRFLASSVLLSCFLALLGGCGSSSDVATSSLTSGSTPSSPLSGETSTLTLRSEVILAKAIETDISSIKFTTTDSKGEVIFSSAPLEKDSVLKVEVPVESTHLKLDYLDASEKLKEIWGSPLPPLKAGGEVVIRQPNPDSVEGVLKLEIITDAEVLTGLHQFKAEVTYNDSSVRDVTNAVTWGAGIGPDGVADLSLRQPSSNFTATAVFGPFTATRTVRLRELGPTGPISVRTSLSGSSISSMSLAGCGEQTQLFVFSNFADNIVREVTASSVFTVADNRVVTVDQRGRMTAVGQGSTTVRVNYARLPSFSLRVVVKDDLAQSIFGNRAESVQSVGNLAGPLLIQDMNGDGFGDLITFTSTGGNVDLSRVFIHPGDGKGRFSSPSAVALPFSGGAGVKPVIFAGRVSRSNTLGVVGPFLSVGSTNSSSLVTVLRGRDGFTARATTLAAPPMALSQVPFSQDSNTAERLLIRTRDGVEFTQVGSGVSNPVNVGGLLSTDLVVSVSNGRGASLVVGKAREIQILNWTGNSTSLSDTEALPNGNQLVDLKPVQDSVVRGFDALVEGGSSRSLLRYAKTDATTSSFSLNRVDGLPAQAVLTPCLIRCDSDRYFNIATSSIGSPLLVLDSSFQALTGLQILNTSRFTAGDLNEDGIDDLVAVDGEQIRVYLLGTR